MNCFQKFVSLLSETTLPFEVMLYDALWIAFKNLYLCCLKQLKRCNKPSRIRCELLSKICIFVVWNNCRQKDKGTVLVVNCFQKFVSLLSETTINQDSGNQTSCELLSKICIFVVWNNKDKKNKISRAVVNCFQKFVSLLSETTKGTCF